MSPELLVPGVELRFASPSYWLPGESYTFTQSEVVRDGLGPLAAIGGDFTIGISSSSIPAGDLGSLGALQLIDIVGDRYDEASFKQFTIPDQSPC